MISRNDRINAFVKLGNYLISAENTTELEELAINANRKNNWFTVPNVLKSLHEIGTGYLSEIELNSWIAAYPENKSPKKIGVIMAGNIPAVGFHDALSVLISGHILLAKLSSEDGILIPALLEKLIEIEPRFAESIRFVERLNDSDAYIATGSDNTARYFHYYFAKKPNIIRHNRTSIAVLSGQESTDELHELGTDIIQYFGLGCRNVSRLFVPEGYDFTKFYESIEPFAEVCLNHHKYFNNYEYNKSVLLINRTQHYDNGFLMMTENPAFVSPISVVYYQNYSSLDDVNSILEENDAKIQCVVTSIAAIPGGIAFGQAQKPSLTDYADGVDTMKFLSSI